jgi:hypothetical protein
MRKRAFFCLPGSCGIFQHFHRWCLRSGAIYSFYSSHLRERIAAMTQTNLPPRHEQRKVEELLLRLSKMKPISAKPAPIGIGHSALRATGTANSRVFFST